MYVPSGQVGLSWASFCFSQQTGIDTADWWYCTVIICLCCIICVHGTETIHRLLRMQGWATRTVGCHRDDSLEEFWSGDPLPAGSVCPPTLPVTWEKCGLVSCV